MSTVNIKASPAVGGKRRRRDLLNGLIADAVVPRQLRIPISSNARRRSLALLGKLDHHIHARNSDAILAQQNAYGAAWQNALSVIQPRFVKLGARWDL